MTIQPQYPVKRRDFHNHHFDSTVWDGFEFRPNDIIIASYAKSGTTWTQQIVAQLLFNGNPNIPVADLSPWMDLRVPPKAVKLPLIEAQQHRRFLKTHLPVDALVFSPMAKYLYIARDGRDVVWSMYNHHANANANWYDMLNGPGLHGSPIEPPQGDVHTYWQDWMKCDGYPWWPFWENIRSWWEIRNLPNVMFLHYNDLKADLPGQIRRIAEFLEIPIDEEQFPRILEHCSFAWMKENATKSVPLQGLFWDGGAQTFIHKGTNGRWHDILTPKEEREYERRAVAELGEECARWLAKGTLA